VPVQGDDGVEQVGEEDLLAGRFGGAAVESGTCG
jgi:hypothetical protein